jgi:hypothetical protein
MDNVRVAPSVMGRLYAAQNGMWGQMMKRWIPFNRGVPRGNPPSPNHP